MSAAPGLTELVGPTLTMGDWGGEAKPECPICTVPIEKGDEFYEAENTGGVAHWACYLPYCVHELNAGRRPMAPPAFLTPVLFTPADYQRLVEYSGREWRNELGRQIRGGGYRYRVDDGLPQAHPKSMRRTAGERRHERRREAKEDEDEDWSPGDA